MHCINIIYIKITCFIKLLLNFIRRVKKISTLSNIDNKAIYTVYKGRNIRLFCMYTQLVINKMKYLLCITLNNI